MFCLDKITPSCQQHTLLLPTISICEIRLWVMIRISIYEVHEWPLYSLLEHGLRTRSNFDFPEKLFENVKIKTSLSGQHFWQMRYGFNSLFNKTNSLFSNLQLFWRISSSCEWPQYCGYLLQNNYHFLLLPQAQINKCCNKCMALYMRKL